MKGRTRMERERVCMREGRREDMEKNKGSRRGEKRDKINHYTHIPVLHCSATSCEPQTSAQEAGQNCKEQL